MSVSSVEKNSCDINPSEMYEKLKSQKYQEKLFNEALTRIKDTVPYKRIKELAIQHMCDNLNGQSLSIPCKQDRQEKKKQIAEIGILALSIDSSISDIVKEKLKEARPDIKKAIQLSIEEVKDDEDDVSVSSVHTSDLSSFDDESSSSEDEKNKKENNELPRKDVNRETTSSPKYLQSSVSKQKKVTKRTSEQLTEKYSEDECDSPAVGKPFKRTRKPNPKYIGDATDEVL